MTHRNGQVPEESQNEIVIVSRDEAFVERVRACALRSRAERLNLTIFHEPIGALVHLITRIPYVVVFDLDSDSLPRSMETLRGIRLIRADLPVILGACEHNAPPFGPGDDVNVFYRLLKSAPDTELEAALESARRCPRH